MLKSLNSLIWRNLQEHRLRALLSGLAVSFGVAMIIAADLVGTSLLDALLNADVEGAEITHGFIAEQFDLMISIVGYVLIAAAGFLVFNAFTMTVTQRQQQIGALRSLGMTRKQVMRLVMLEGLLLGVIGVIVGLLAGPLMGYGVIALLNLIAGKYLSFGSSPAVSPTAVFQATIMGLAITLLSIWWPSRRASRVAPLVALRSEIGDWRLGKRYKNLQSLLSIFGFALLLAIAAFVLIAVPGNWADAPVNSVLAVGLIVGWLVGWLLLLPLLIRFTGKLARRGLGRWGANGRLIGDNLQREQGRVMLTIVTLAMGLVMIVGMTGFMTFMFDELFGASLNRVTAKQSWAVFPFDLGGGVFSIAEADTMLIDLADIATVETAVGDQATVAPTYFVLVPEISFLGEGYFSYVLDPDIPRAEKAYFEFSKGDWESAWPLLQEGCGLLTTPSVAQRNGVDLYDSLTISTPHGPLDCTIAGIGRPFMNATIINSAVGDYFDLTRPVGIAIFPHDGVNGDTFNAKMAEVQNQLPHLWMTNLVDYAAMITDVVDLFAISLNVLLLLVVVAAAFGVVNTMVMSVIERRAELGLLRAIGATRRQVELIMVGEAALMGVIGGFLGLVMGLGVVVIIVMVFGGRSWGIMDLDLWAAAGRTLPSALMNGFVGLILTPIVAGIAAWLPVRSLLRGSPIDILQSRRQPVRASSRPSRLFGWGTIRARFAVGTAVLLFLTLWGLITFVGNHARDYMDDLAAQTVEAMVGWNVKLAETNLADDATALSTEMLPTGQFDADMMLQMESLIDGMTDNGMADFYIVDQDKIVLFGADPREVGAVKDDLEWPESLTTAVAKTDTAREMHTIAPIQNKAGQTLGAISLTMRLDWIDDFLGELQRALWLVGGFISLIGVALSWAIATPFVRATRALSSSAVATGSGEFQPIQQRPSNWITRHTSLKTRLTAVLIGILILMVGTLQLLTIPIERQRLEETLQEVTLTGAEWMGQAFADFGYGMGDFSFADLLDPGMLTDKEGGTFANLPSASDMQELAELMQNEYAAYAAIADEEGTVQFANQLKMVGEELGSATATTLTETDWDGEPIWAIATPMRDADEVQVGTLHIGVRLTAVDEFISESRNLFMLTGIIAVLAGIIVAQLIGGAVAAPVNQLAIGTRRIGQGDLTVQFQVNSKDELAQLANAYNEMVVGLREREWLRDMFGRFVSQEVAEAIRTGQVKLEGENRVVSILFCDIRGFTARSEKSTPAEIVALLNEYLPVVVSAAQNHEGTVNKFGGDSTLVIYGAPRQLQESAYQAVLTALEMRRNLDLLNEVLTQRGEEPIRIGVGINTGMVLAGAVGPPERQEYTVIGDTVNLASRIESLNKEYPQHGILISGQTYEALGSRRTEFMLTDLGELEIRGKTDLVQVWAIDQIRAA